jgi:hypothetical protein
VKDIVMKNNAGRMVPVVVLLASVTAAASAQQVMWKDNPITGKVVGLTYGTSGWNAAEAQAVAYGGHLVTIRSQSEQDWLRTNFSSFWSSASGGPWHGLNDVQAEGEWRWVSGEPTNFQEWGFGEPNNGTTANHAHFWNPSSGWKWNDEYPNAHLRALFEVAQRPPRSWSWPSTVYTGTALYFQSLADHDGDGDLDVAMQDHGDGNVWILKNDGTGSFSIHQSIPIPWPMNSIGYDWGNDGNMDLLVVSSLPSPGGSVYLLTKNSAGMFVNQGIALDFKGAWSIESSDVNADGLDDLLVTSFSPVPAVGVYLSNANKTFASQPSSVVSLTSTYPYFSAVKDLDGDGDKDVAVGSNSQIHILKNTGNGSFLAMPSLGSGGCTRPMLVDVDGDGDIDIVQFRDASSECVVWSNDGGANFTPSGLFATQGASRDSDIADLNADGLLDIVVANMSTDTTDVYLANSNGQYVFDHSLASGDYPLGARIGDLNGDGKGDICITNHLSRTLAVMLNQSRFDCNGNGIEDATDIANGTAVDCNNNKRPDSCDIAFGYSQDANNDGVLDECIPTLVSITPSTRPAALSGNVTLNATNIPAGPATLTPSRLSPRPAPTTRPRRASRCPRSSPR